MPLFSSSKVPLAAILCYLLARSWPPAKSNLPLSSSTNSERAVILFSCAIVSYAIWSRWIYPNFFSPLRHLPRVSVPWQNSVYRWLYSELDPGELLKRAQNTPNNGLLYYTGVGGTPSILLTNRESLKEVLVTKAYAPFEKPSLVRQRIGVLAGWGIISAEGEMHKIQRSKLLPAFHRRHIKGLFPLFWTKAAETSNTLLVEFQKANTGKEDSILMNIAAWTSRAALDIIGVAAWGKELSTIASPNSDFHAKYRKIFDPNTQGTALSILGLFVPMWFVAKLPFKFNNILRDGIGAVRYICKEAIREERLRRSNGHKPENNLLSIAVDSNLFNDAELEEQMMSILAAGHETSGLTAAWACFMLCKHNQVQKRLRKEIRSSLPSPSDNETEVDADMLESLPYLKAVTNELLRLIPAVPVTRREAGTDTTVVGQFIPKGTWMLASGWVTNRLVDNWGEDAATFNPERWLSLGNENTGGVKNNFDNMTFSHGPRSCLGMGFARAELLAILAALVGRFQMELDDPTYEPVIEFGITVHAKGGLKMNIKPLEGW